MARLVVGHMTTKKKFLPVIQYFLLFSKLCTLLHKTVAWKIVETVPSINISHGWMETNGPCSSSKISSSFYRLFILLNLKQLRTYTMKSWEIYIFDLISIFVQFFHHFIRKLSWQHVWLTAQFLQNRQGNFEESGA